MAPKNSCNEGLCCCPSDFSSVDTDEPIRLLSLLRRPDSRCSPAWFPHRPLYSRVSGVRESCSSTSTPAGNGLRESPPFHFAGSLVQKIEDRHVPQNAGRKVCLVAPCSSQNCPPHTWFQQKGTVLRVRIVLAFKKNLAALRVAGSTVHELSFPVPSPAVFIFGGLPCLGEGF